MPAETDPPEARAPPKTLSMSPLIPFTTGLLRTRSMIALIRSTTLVISWTRIAKLSIAALMKKPTALKELPRAVPNAGARFFIMNRAISLTRVKNGSSFSLLRSTASATDPKADFKPLMIGVTVLMTDGMSTLTKKSQNCFKFGMSVSLMKTAISSKVGFSFSPSTLESSPILGITLFTRPLTSGVIASSTNEPTVSLPSSKATWSRCILPAKVSACAEACPPNVAAKAA